MILHICDNPDILSVMRIINLIIMIIKIFVPIILIVICMIDFMNAIKVGSEDLLKKAQKMAINRAIAAVIIFTVPTFVNVLAKMSSSEGTTYLSCISNATIENIDAKYIARAEELIARADENKDYNDYYSAVSALTNVRDKELKKTYQEKLDGIYEIIKKEIEEAEKSASGYTPGGSSEGGVTNAKMPYYAQCDSRWGSKSYNGTNLCNAGCGYSSLAMVLSGLKNDSSINPDTVHEYIYGQGISVNPGGGAITDAALVSSKVASRYGVKIETLFGRNYDESSSKKASEASAIQNALNQGKGVVLLIPGHYIALGGTGNAIIVHDPANSGRNGTYTIDELHSKYYNYSNRCSNGGTCGFVYAVAYSL